MKLIRKLFRPACYLAALASIIILDKLSNLSDWRPYLLYIILLMVIIVVGLMVALGRVMGGKKKPALSSDTAESGRP